MHVLKYLSISHNVLSSFLKILNLYYYTFTKIVTYLQRSSISFTAKFIILSGLSISQLAKWWIRTSSLHLVSQLSSLSFAWSFVPTKKVYKIKTPISVLNHSLPDKKPFNNNNIRRISKIILRTYFIFKFFPTYHFKRAPLTEHNISKLICEFTRNKGYIGF